MQTADFVTAPSGSTRTAEADTFVGAIQNGELRWVPDGMRIDAQDAIWVADAIGRRALRIKDGRVGACL